MKPYHTDLRKRIVDAYEKAEGSVRELAVRFKVRPGTVQDYLNLKRETGSVEPRSHGGGPAPKLDDAGVRELRAVVEEKNDRTLDEIANELDRRRQVRVGRTTVWRLLDRLGITRKKKDQHAAEQERPEVQAEREAFQQQIEQVEPACLFYVDEFGFRLNMTRDYARAPQGERANAAVPFRRGPAITLVMALGLSGIVAPCAFQGAMNGHIFGLYMAEQLIPHLPPNAIVVVDNLSAHDSEDAHDALVAHGHVVVDDQEDDDGEVADALEKPGIQVWFLPPYSPELSAVEECGSKVKALVRGAEPRSVSDLIDALGDAIGKVTPQDARGWFNDARHARVQRPRPQAAADRGAASSPATGLKQGSG